MIRYILIAIIIMLINVMVISVDAQIQSTQEISSTDMIDRLQSRDEINKIKPDSKISTETNILGYGAQNNNVVKILGLDSTTFPKIKVNILINKSCALDGNLKQENFKVIEDDQEMAINNLDFSGNSSGYMLDLAVVFDDTGSMGEEISAMKSKVKELTDRLKSSGIDARYALVTFKDSYSVKTNWTNDPVAFKSAVNSLQQKGGDDRPEVSLDAIEAVLAMGFRSDAQKVIVAITDAPAHCRDDGSTLSSYTKEEIKKDLKGSGAIFIPISPTFDKSSTYVDLREVANDIQSMWIDINSADFTTIIEQIQGMLTGTYGIEYTSPDLAPAENRTVLVSVNAPGCLEGSASGFYITPGSAFAEPQSALFISGRVFNDSNGDGVKGADEAGLVGWDVMLDGPDGYATAKTDVKGFYIFTGLPPGIYGLGAVTQGSWTATVPAEGVQSLELVDTHESEIDFGFRLPLAEIVSNNLPVINQLVSVELGGLVSNITGEIWDFQVSDAIAGTIITWKTEASDPDGDQILYKFFLNDKPITDWTTDNWWNWTTNDADIGSNRIEVQVRDEKHAGPNGWDDRSSDGFNVTAPNSVVNSGNQFEEFNRTFGGVYGDEARSVQLTSDGGFILAGQTGTSSWGGDETWLIKTDSEGNEEWYRSIDGVNSFGNGDSVQQTSDGGYILAGHQAIYHGEGVWGGSAAWLIKTDARGNEEWEKTFGNNFGDNCANSIMVTSDGGYALAGCTHNTRYSIGYSKDAWLIKTDANGNEIWNSTFGTKEHRDEAYSVLPTSDGGYVLAGLSESSSEWEESDEWYTQYDAWLIKTDAEGILLWNRTLSRGVKGNGLLLSMQPTNDGGYILAGSTWTGDETGDAWLIKTDSEGNELWSKTFGGEFRDNFNSVRPTSDGGYIVAGDTGYSRSGRYGAWLIKTDSEGNGLWSKTFGGELYNFNSVRPTSDGGYIILGTIHDSYLWLIKVDAEGNLIRLPT